MKAAGGVRPPNRDPSDIELGTIAQTWSEHAHKTLKAGVKYTERGSERANERKETWHSS
jgi:phosphoribosylformylglycinamidine (FGAM) synthase-like enzyme